MIHLILIRLLAWSLALAWFWKAATSAVGLRRVPNLSHPEFDLTPAAKPTLAVIVPARNEASSVGACLESLLAQDYPNLHIYAVDDRSTDATGSLMDTFAATHPGKMTVLHITELPDGWLGKTHAMAMAAARAIAECSPAYLLFTDADVLFSPTVLRLSLARAVATAADHFVTMPTPIAETHGEAMFLGFLRVMGLWAVRLWRVEDPRAMRDAMGIGAFNLMRTSAYLSLGGFAALQMEIVEDLTLARRVKLAGLRQRVAFAPDMVRLHWAKGLTGVVNVMTKNLFAIFRFRISLVLLGCFGLAAFDLAPIVFIVTPGLRVAGLIALGSIAWMYRLSGRPSGISPWNALLFPFSAAVFIYSMLRSTAITLKDGGVTWRGTFYPLSELRRRR